MISPALHTFLVSITHRSKGDRGSGQADQAAVSGVGLMHSIGIVMAELLDDFLNPLMFTFEDGIANDLL